MPTTPHSLSGTYGRAALLGLGERIVEHAHRQAHVLIKLAGADSCFRVAGRRLAVRDDSVILIDPWVPHAGPSRPGAGETTLLLLYFEPGDGLTTRRPVFDRASARLTPALREQVQRLGRRMRDERALPDEVDALLQAVLAEHGHRASAGLAHGQMDFRIRRVLRQIEADPAFARDVDACASVACLSRSHFFHLFRESTGVSPQLFFNALRLERAIDQLGSSTLPIHALAEQLGFSAAAHFTRFFRGHTGSTPRAFRQGALTDLRA